MQDVTEQEHCAQLCSALVDCKAYMYYADLQECYPMMNVNNYVVTEQAGYFYGVVSRQDLVRHRVRRDTEPSSAQDGARGGRHDVGVEAAGS